MKQLVGLERSQPYLALGGKIKPTEIDAMWQYVIMKPSVSDSAVMNTANGTSLTGTVTLAYPDYPRSLCYKFTDATGTTCISTATIYGKDQFGNTISEAIVQTQTGTSTTNGTAVFAYVGTITLGHANAAAGDAHQIGYAIGAATATFGLPLKCGTAADVKKVTWVDNGVVTPGTATFVASVNGLKFGAAIEAADDYIVFYKPDYRVNDDEHCNMASEASIA